jgi:hypothetical protein
VRRSPDFEPSARSSTRSSRPALRLVGRCPRPDQPWLAVKLPILRLTKANRFACYSLPARKRKIDDEPADTDQRL